MYQEAPKKALMISIACWFLSHNCMEVELPPYHPVTTTALSLATGVIRHTEEQLQNPTNIAPGAGVLLKCVDQVC